MGATSFREQWDRETRWARCIRVSRPWEYPGLLLTFSTPLAIAFALATRLAPEGEQVLTISLLLRWLVAWQVTRYTDDRESRKWLILLPIRDMLSVLIWCAGAMGRQVTWRGERFALTADGRLRPSPQATHKIPSSVLRWAIRGLDALLRRCYHIQEFNQEEDCILRIALHKSDEEVLLSDGTRVLRGDLIGELHLWNEHIPPMPPEGPDLVWAFTFRRWMARSLAALAAYVESDPRFRDVKAFRGILAIGSGDGLAQVARAADRWGFDLLDQQEPAGLLTRFLSFWQKLYTWGIIWTFNPSSLNGKNLRRLKHRRFWISRKQLLDRYGTERDPSS